MIFKQKIIDMKQKSDLQKKFIYAIKTSELKSQGLEIIQVKIGFTNNVERTLKQYRRANKEADILDIWESTFNSKKCEKGVHLIAKKFAYENKGEVFTFLQDTYTDFSEIISLLLNRIEKNDLHDNTIVSIKKNKKGRVIKNKSVKPKYIIIGNQKISIKSWTDYLDKSIEYLYKKDRRRFIETCKEISYFNKNKNVLRRPRQVTNENLYYETNLNSDTIKKIVKQLLSGFNLEENYIKSE